MKTVKEMVADYLMANGFSALVYLGRVSIEGYMERGSIIMKDKLEVMFIIYIYGSALGILILCASAAWQTIMCGCGNA